MFFTPLPSKLREKLEEKPNTVNIQEFQNLVAEIKLLLHRFVLEQEETSNKVKEIPSHVVKYIQNKKKDSFSLEKDGAVIVPNRAIWQNIVEQRHSV